MNQSLYTKFVSRCLFPVHEKLKQHHSVRILQLLELSQWLTKDKIIEQQGQRLHNFIANADQNIPYYRDLLDSLGLTPDDFHCASDLSKLPFLTKPIITANYAQFTAPNAGKMINFSTAGSSGTPLAFLVGMDRVSHDVAEKWRATRWWGVDIGDKEQVVWGSPIELGTQDRIKQIRDLLLRSKLLPAFDLTPQKIEQFLLKITNYRPKMLFGYPSVYALMAKYALAHEIKLDNLGIKVVFVTSELLYSHQREVIEQVFGCPVANGYGGRDAGFIAHQCPEGGMHISAEDIIVEIVDPDGNVVPDGQSGQVVTTHLATGDFPFIRYRTGDVATISTKKCACGRGLPMLEDIHGRTNDFITTADGRLMHGSTLTYVMREFAGIANFKIIQHSALAIEIILVMESGQLADSLRAEINRAFKQRLGQEVEVAIILTEHIAVEKSGKYRFLISNAVNESFGNL